MSNPDLQPLLIETRGPTEDVEEAVAGGIAKRGGTVLEGESVARACIYPKPSTHQGLLDCSVCMGTRYISSRAVCYWTIIFIRGAKILRKQGLAFPALPVRDARPDQHQVTRVKILSEVSGAV
jgi:hypothetical protein